MPLPWNLTLSLLLLFLSPPTTVAGDNPTPYEIIESFNFPRGILPKGVVGYELDRETGKFKALLNGSCSFALEGSYQLKYKSTITGTISNNRLANLTGVTVKILFLWLNIVEVSRDGDDLDFSVGIASAAFAIDNFYESPQCGCGFDCVDRKEDSFGRAQKKSSTGTRTVANRAASAKKADVGEHHYHSLLGLVIFLVGISK